MKGIDLAEHHAREIGRGALGRDNWNSMTKKFTDVSSSFSQMKSWKAGAMMGAGVIAAGGLSYGASYMPSGVGMMAGGGLGAAAGWRAADQIAGAAMSAGWGGAGTEALAGRKGFKGGWAKPGAAPNLFGASRAGKWGAGIGGAALGAIGGRMAMGVNRWMWD